MNTRRGVLFVFLAGLLWASLPILSRLLLARGLDSIAIATLRSSLAALTLWLWGLLFKRDQLRIRARDIPFFMLYGALCVPAMYLCYFGAIGRVPAGVAAILLYTSPAFVMLLSRVLFKERLTRVKLASLALALLGCALVVDLLSTRQSLDPMGVLLGLGAGLSYASMGLFGRAGLGRYSAYTNMTYMLSFGALYMLALRPPWVLLQSALAPDTWALAAGIALIGTVLPNTLYVAALHDLDTGTASIVATVEPVVVTALAATLLSEPVSAMQALGMALVIAGVCLPLYVERQRMQPAKTGSK